MSNKSHSKNEGDMESEPINMMAKFTVPRGTESRFRQAFIEMIVPSRAEAGCIAYDLFQLESDSTSFLLYERWRNQAALNYHFSTPYFQKFKAEFPDIFARTLSSGLTHLVELRPTV